MKKSILKVAFWVLLTIVLLAIAIPTFTVNINNQYYKVHGIDPEDVSSTYLIKDFKFLPSLELNGGSIGTVNVDLSSVAADKKDATFNLDTQNFMYRLYSFQSFLKRSFKTVNFDVQQAVSTDNSAYKIIAKFPDIVDSDRLSIFTTPGNVTIWKDDSTNIESTYTEEQIANMAYGERAITKLSNDDIASVNVITDASCYFNDSTTPRNYCLKMTFKASAQSKFNEAFVTTTTYKYPPILVVDGAVVGVLSMGQSLSSTNPGLSIDWYPLLDDDYETTAILASILNDSPLSSGVSLGEFNTIEPTAGSNTLKTVEIALLTTFIVINVLMAVYFRKRSWFAIVSSCLFVIYTVAIMKIFNLVLDTALIVGGVASFLIFLSFIIYILYQIRTASKSGLTETEIEDLYANTRRTYTHFTILTCFLALIMTYFAPAFLLSMFIGFGFGVIMGYVIICLPVAHLLKILFLKSSEWKIW